MEAIQPLPVPNCQSGKIRVLIVDEYPVVREGLSALLSNIHDIEIVGKFDASSIMQANELPPADVVLMDFIPSAAIAIHNVTEMIETLPRLRVAIFSATMSEEHAYRALQAGATGYLNKACPISDIVSCIRALARGEKWIPQEIRAILAKRLSSPELTKRERDVLSAMASGKSNKQIGALLRMSEGTVKIHVTHILGKLKAAGRVEALVVAASRGLLFGPTKDGERSSYRAQAIS